MEIDTDALYQVSKSYKMPLPIKGNEIETSIEVNKNSHDPDKAWSILGPELINLVEKVEPLKLDTPIYENKVRFVCISDTHSKIHKMHHDIPNGDILIHAGDFSKVGSLKEVIEFSDFLKTLDQKFKYKVVIAGNHELSFDHNCKMLFYAKNSNSVHEEPRDHLKNCIYLEDSYVDLYGLKIYGAPWQPEFCNWAFNIRRGQNLLSKWNMIPDDIDILITHGPPLGNHRIYKSNFLLIKTMMVPEKNVSGVGDVIRSGYHVGCTELLSTIRERVKPKLHVFGHIHEDHGIWTDGITTYANASTCNLQYNPRNPPILFDIDLPKGVTKETYEITN